MPVSLPFGPVALVFSCQRGAYVFVFPANQQFMLSVYVVFTLLLSILWITTMARFLGNQPQCEKISNQIRQIISVGGERRSGQRRKPGRFFDSFPSKLCQTNPLPLLLSSYCKSCVKSSPKVFEGEKRLQQRCLLMYHRKLPVVATRLGWQHKTADTAATWHGRMGHACAITR